MMHIHDDKKEGVDIGCVFLLRLLLPTRRFPLLFFILFMTFCDTNGDGRSSVTTSLLQLVIRVTILIAAEENTVTTLYNLH